MGPFYRWPVQCTPKWRRYLVAKFEAAIAQLQDVVLLQPLLELRRGAQTERRACIQGIVKRGGLVVQHHIVGAGNAHDEIDAGRAEQGEQHVHVVLIGVGMIGVADVAAHRYAEQLAADVILQPGADDLLAVVEIFRADEAHHGVHQQWFVVARHRIGAHLAGLLIHAVVRIGRQRAALAGFEIHHVVADIAATQRQARFITFLQQGQVDAEAGIGRLGAGDRPKHQVHRHATADRFDGGDMRKQARTIGWGSDNR